MKRREMTRIEMMREIRECWREVPEGSYIEKVYEAVFDVLKQKPCEDAISRENILLAIDNIKDNYGGLLDVARIVRESPSVYPKPKAGHWINGDCKGGNCSICGKYYAFYAFYPESGIFDYCPNCGAKMEEEE